MKYKAYKAPKEKKEKYNKNDLTDNVKFNERFSPIYFLLLVYILHTYFNLNIITNFFSSAVFYSSISTLLYLFSSNYFQPDLDIMTNRPGMGHFPLGRWIGSYKIGRVLKMFLYPINRLWYWLWHPYGKLLTHRGVGHWPVIGVWLRVSYLIFWLWIIKYFLIKINISDSNIMFIYNWLLSFFPWDKNFGNFNFLLFCFPIYLSDMVHIGVDFYDSWNNQRSFCPPKIPRGLIMKTINTIRGVR